MSGDGDGLFELMRPGRWPDGRTWLVDGERTWSRGEARAAVTACVARLRERGLGPGDRVLALLDHDVRGVLFLAAASALGLRLLMPYNLAAAAAAEWRTIAAAARPDAVVCVKRDPTGAAELGALVLGDELLTAPAAGAPEVEPVAGAADFLVLFTSGTTGAPKAIAVSERVVARRVAAVSGRLGFTPSSRLLLSGLLNNTTGVLFAFGALLHGATVVVPSDRDVATWPALVARKGVTHMMLRPVALRRFLDAAGDADLSSLAVVAYGAAAMPRSVLAAGRARMPCAWVQGYGLSETYGPFCWLDEAAHRAGRHRGEPYCVGRPDRTVEVRLEPVAGHADGVGEVLVRGTELMTGYLDVATGALRPPGEWLRTGDLGRWSPDGDLLLQGRLAGSLLSADGHRIYPEEVEAVLADLPGVDDAVLVGVTVPGAPAPRPAACLSGPIGLGAPDAVRETVVAALRAVLSPEKWPDLVSATAAPFPRGSNDKVLRAAVAAGVDPASLVAVPAPA